MTRHRYDCRVRFSDVDVYGHVNNVKYFEYYQEARLVFLGSLSSAGVGAEAAAERAAENRSDSFSLVVARVDVDYRRPILFRTEPYVVESWITRVGGSSFTLGSEIRDGDEVLSRAETVLVTFDHEQQRARPLTPGERDRLLSAAED